MIYKELLNEFYKHKVENYSLTDDEIFNLLYRTRVFSKEFEVKYKEIGLEKAIIEKLLEEKLK